MTIIKKSGKKEEFLSDKLSHSISAAAQEAGDPIKENDLRKIISDFQTIVHGKALITTQQVDVIVCGILYTKKHYGALEKYVSYHEKR